LEVMSNTISVTIQKHSPSVVALTAVAKETDWGTNAPFRVRCEALSRMQNGVEGRGNRRVQASGFRLRFMRSGLRCYRRKGRRDHPGRSDMANRLPPVAAIFISAFLLSGLTDARASDPGSCRQYAKAALGQVRAALADPRCGAGVQGVRWSTDFSIHYEWCLGASLDAAGTESAARTRYLRACTGR
jgi:hypothetical protein